MVFYSDYRDILLTLMRYRNTTLSALGSITQGPELKRQGLYPVEMSSGSSSLQN